MESKLYFNRRLGCVGRYGLVDRVGNNTRVIYNSQGCRFVHREAVIAGGNLRVACTG